MPRCRSTPPELAADGRRRLAPQALQQVQYAEDREHDAERSPFEPEELQVREAKREYAAGEDQYQSEDALSVHAVTFFVGVIALPCEKHTNTPVRKQPVTKSDAADAHLLADMVRVDVHQLRAIAGDSSLSQAIKTLTRAHKKLIFERARHTNRLSQALREYFPGALDAFDDLNAPDVLELLGKAPDPHLAARLSRGQIRAALKRARRRNVEKKAGEIQAALRAEQLGRDEVVVGAYAATTRATVAVLGTLNEQIAVLESRWNPILGSTRTLRSSPLRRG